MQAKKKELNAEAAKDKGVGLADRGYFDIDLYDGGDTNSKYEGYVTSIAPNDDIDDEEDEGLPIGRNNRPMGYTAPAALLNEMGQVSMVVRWFVCQRFFVANVLCFVPRARTTIRLPSDVNRRWRRRRMNTDKSEDGWSFHRSVSIRLQMVRMWVVG